MSSNISVRVYGKDCIGCERNNKPIMLSLGGKDELGKFTYLDAFLTDEEVKELILELQKVMVENEQTCK